MAQAIIQIMSAMVVAMVIPLGLAVLFGILSEFLS